MSTDLSAPAGAFETDLFIDGVAVPGAAGRLENVDPGSGEVIGSVGLADEAQVDAAVAAASAAFPSWSTLTGAARGAVLTTAAARLEERCDEAVGTILRETGKTLGDARGEIQRAIDTLRWNGEQAARLSGTVLPGTTPGARRLSIPTPLGVVVAITAWNFPAVLVTRKLGAALAAGCTVVLKASEYAPATARLLVDVLADAGLPSGVVNLVFGDPEAVSRRLLAASAVRALTFTGSTGVGTQLAALAAPRLLRTVLELGGHAPVIVWRDADIENVVATTAPAKFGSAGQSCVAPSRYYVHAARYEEFVEALARVARAHVVGHGFDEGVTLGAVAHRGRVDELVALTDDAVARGARLVTGGTPVDRPGSYFAPTVLADVPAGRGSSWMSRSARSRRSSRSPTWPRRSRLPTTTRTRSRRTCSRTR